MIPNKSSVSSETELEESQSWDQAMTGGIDYSKEVMRRESIKIGRAMKQAREVPVDVVDELEDFMTRPPDQLNWMNPKRRLLAMNPTWWLPGRGGCECGDLCAGLDESGSVSDPEIQGLCSVFTDILDRHPAGSQVLVNSF